jgi:CBS domain-containing protein
VPVGVVSALAALALLRLIGLITNLVFYQRFDTHLVAPGGAHHPWWLILLAPVAGGLVVGMLARYGSEKIRGHGMPEAIEAILTGGSRVAPRVAVLKPLSAAISIGTGGPFGAEGPIIMTGGAVGSILAQTLKLTADERKTLLVAGAAGGMAATFNAPLASVLLAVELLLFEWRPRSLIPVTAAVTVSRRGRRGDAVATDRHRVHPGTDPRLERPAADGGRLGGRLHGVRAAAQAIRAHRAGTVADATTPALATSFADDTLRDVANNFAIHEVSSAPVVDRRDHDRLVGVIGIAQLLHARRSDLHEEHHRERLLPGWTRPSDLGRNAAAPGPSSTAGSQYRKARA